jgi:hypothetical protein
LAFLATQEDEGSIEVGDSLGGASRWMQDSREIGKLIPGGGRRCKVQWHVEFRRQLSKRGSIQPKAEINPRPGRSEKSEGSWSEAPVQRER